MQFYKGCNINIYIKNIKYILYRLLPILILIGTVLFFQYGYTIEYFFSRSLRAKMRAKIEKKKKGEDGCKKQGYKSCLHKKQEDKCIDAGYKSCLHKKQEDKCKKQGYKSCLHKKQEDKCIDAGYKSCLHKKQEDGCKKQGYKSCLHKKQEDKCIDAGYKSCLHKKQEDKCKKEGYDDCKDKNKKKLFETKSKKDTETMIHNAKRIELLGIDLGNRQVYSAPAITI